MVLAYSQNLRLLDSYIGVYKIYILRHPQTKVVFYVGQTVNDLKIRLSAHIKDSYNQEKSSLIKEIIEQGGEPTIEAIETIKVKCYVDKLYVDDKEIFWMNHYKEIGQPITNVSGMNKDGKNEYRGYLSSLKRGETKWHYYYCGKTEGGIDVYDKERVIADGFSFPEEQENGYSPTDYQRFIDKIKGLFAEQKRPIITERFPPEPQWSNEFKNSIPYENDGFDEYEDDWEDPDYETDCDYEPDSDFEDEYDNDDSDSEESWQPESEDAGKPKPIHPIDIYLKQQIEENRTY